VVRRGSVCVEFATCDAALCLKIICDINGFFHACSSMIVGLTLKANLKPGANIMSAFTPRTSEIPTE